MWKKVINKWEIVQQNVLYLAINLKEKKRADIKF
jgi:hypothetical protein